ncbi:MAG: GspH/FimT family pseudopilin [Geminicoccaceae bacterium]
MVKIRTSPAGRPVGSQQRQRRLRCSRQGGFTLLELLVVLAVIALLATAIPGFLLRNNDALDLDRATRKVAEALRSTQSAAIVENRDQLFGLDVERRRFLAGGTKALVTLPPAIDLRLVTARQEQVGSSTGHIRFHPDGSSTGGRITLELRSHRRMIDVDWLTGRISVHDETG